jgi:hypothetical protein
MQQGYWHYVCTVVFLKTSGLDNGMGCPTITSTDALGRRPVLAGRADV